MKNQSFVVSFHSLGSTVMGFGVKSSGFRVWDFRIFGFRTTALCGCLVFALARVVQVLESRVYLCSRAWRTHLPRRKRMSACAVTRYLLGARFRAKR
jgi:hypothetical protein